MIRTMVLFSCMLKLIRKKVETIMNKELLLQANVDYENGKSRFAGNEALYEKYLLKFKEDAHYGLASAAYESGDYETLLKEAHTLKGVAGTLGLTDVYATSAAIVTALREDRKEAVPELFSEMERSYKEIINILSV